MAFQFFQRGDALALLIGEKADERERMRLQPRQQHGGHEGRRAGQNVDGQPGFDGGFQNNVAGVGHTGRAGVAAIFSPLARRASSSSTRACSLNFW